MNDWESVRRRRDMLLAESDISIPPDDAPASLRAEWVAYRQELRGLPSAWSGVGTSTYLVMYPFDPTVSRTRTPGVTAPNVQERDYNLQFTVQTRSMAPRFLPVRCVRQITVTSA